MRLKRRGWLVLAASLVMPGMIGMAAGGERLARAKSQAPTVSGGVALVVKGVVKQELQLTMADLKGLARTKVTAKDHDGVAREYEGVALQALLAKAGVPLGGELRGKNMTLVVVAEGSDGYKAVFSVAELDEDFAREQVVVVDSEDGKALDAAHGPLRLVVPGDKRQGRWVRLLKSITVMKAGE
jgi:DMSO/TMAO reductase YedYZ molybdopterin-dependent catalytic subunit